jgi:hypothetical protein
LIAGRQLDFGDDELSSAKRQTGQEKLFTEMDKVVPWEPLINLIEPSYSGPPEKQKKPELAVDLYDFHR